MEDYENNVTARCMSLFLCGLMNCLHTVGILGSWTAVVTIKVHPEKQIGLL